MLEHKQQALETYNSVAGREENIFKIYFPFINIK